MDKDELNKNLEQIWTLLRDLDTKVDVHIAEEAQWKPQMLALSESWVQAKGVLNFIKSTAAIGAGIAAFWTFISKYITWKS